MRRAWSGMLGACASAILNRSLALANEPKGGSADYNSISYMYYTLIGIILVYGVYDAFFKKS